MHHFKHGYMSSSQIRYAYFSVHEPAAASTLGVTWRSWAGMRSPLRLGVPPVKQNRRYFSHKQQKTNIKHHSSNIQYIFPSTDCKNSVKTATMAVAESFQEQRLLTWSKFNTWEVRRASKVCRHAKFHTSFIPLKHQIWQPFEFQDLYDKSSRDFSYPGRLAATLTPAPVPPARGSRPGAK